MAKQGKLRDNDVEDLLKEIKNEHTLFESKYKNILDEYIDTTTIKEEDFENLFSLTNNYKQYNLPYSTFTRFIFEVGEDTDLSNFTAELKECLNKKIDKLKKSDGEYDLDRKQTRIMAKIIEHTELALSQKNNLYTKQKELIDELTRELNSSKEEITSLTTELNSSSQKITTLTNSVSSHKFDLIALMSVVFTIFTVLGVNASIIAAIATIKDLNICKMIGLFAFGNITLAIMICCIMKFSKKYYMDFINNRN